MPDHRYESTIERDQVLSKVVETQCFPSKTSQRLFWKTIPVQSESAACVQCHCRFYPAVTFPVMGERPTCKYSYFHRCNSSNKRRTRKDPALPIPRSIVLPSVSPPFSMNLSRTDVWPGTGTFHNKRWRVNKVTLEHMHWLSSSAVIGVLATRTSLPSEEGRKLD